jgi:hypothetical protein
MGFIFPNLALRLKPILTCPAIAVASLLVQSMGLPGERPCGFTVSNEINAREHVLPVAETVSVGRGEMNGVNTPCPINLLLVLNQIVLELLLQVLTMVFLLDSSGCRK